MRIFITGGAGFIGSHLVNALLLKGNCVTVFDNLSNGKIKFIKHHFLNPKFKFIKGDLLKKNSLNKALSDSNTHDIVWHLASNVDIKKTVNNPKEDFEQEIVATFNLLEQIKKVGIIFNKIEKKI